MIKKFVSLTLASTVLLTTFSSNASASSLSDLVSPITKKTLYISPNNITNVQIVDENGTVIDGVTATVKNSSGTAVAEFSEYTQTPASSYFKTLNNSGITSESYSVDLWSQCNQLMSPSTVYSVESTSSAQTEYYESGEVITVGDSYTETLLLNHFDHTRALDYSLPSASYAVYVDDDWASKTGRGFINYTTDDSNIQYFDTADGFRPAMLGNIQLYLTMDPNYSFEAFRMGVLSEVDNSGGGYYLYRYPKISDTPSQYIKYTVNLCELFPECNMYEDFEYKYIGTFVDEKNIIFDPKQDMGGTNQTSCVLTVTSGAVISAPIPDIEGNIEFYLDKNSREYSIELNVMHIEETVNPDFSVTRVYRSGSDYVDLVAEDKCSVSVQGADLPDSGTNLLNLNNESYTIELSNVPSKYSNEPFTFSVTDSQAVQYINIVLEDKTLLGDVNNDNTINSSDASSILAEYASLSSGGTATLDLASADVNKDGALNSSDASAILAYYAYISSGGTGSIETFLGIE